MFQLVMTIREREPMTFTQPISGVPFEQICENCGATFRYHYRVHYCPDCEDVIYGTEEPVRGDHNDKDIQEIERIRTENANRNKVDRSVSGFYKYTVEYDPIPDELGGMVGAKLNLEEVEAALRTKSFEPGMILRYDGQMVKRRYKVVCKKDGMYKLEEIENEK